MNEVDPCGNGLKCKSMTQAFAYSENFQPSPDVRNRLAEAATMIAMGAVNPQKIIEESSPSRWFASVDGICIKPDYDQTKEPPLVWGNAVPEKTRYQYRDTSENPRRFFLLVRVGNAGDTETGEVIEPIRARGKGSQFLVWNGGVVAGRIDLAEIEKKYNGAVKFDRWIISPSSERQTTQSILGILQQYNPTIDLSYNSPDLKKPDFKIRVAAKSEGDWQVLYDNNAGFKIYPSFIDVPKPTLPASPSVPDDSDTDTTGIENNSPNFASTGGQGEGVAGKMNGTFESVGAFAAALSAGVQEDIDKALTPIKAELNQLRALIGDAATSAAAAAAAAQSAQNTANAASSAASNAQNAADTAASAANNAQNTANNPPPSPSSVAGTGTPVTTPSTESPAPQPTPSIAVSQATSLPQQTCTPEGQIRLAGSPACCSGLVEVTDSFTGARVCRQGTPSPTPSQQPTETTSGGSGGGGGGAGGGGMNRIFDFGTEGGDSGAERLT